MKKKTKAKLKKCSTTEEAGIKAMEDNEGVLIKKKQEQLKEKKKLQKQEQQLLYQQQV